MPRELKPSLTINLPQAKSLAVSPDGKYIAASNEDYDTVHVFAAKDGKPLAKLDGHGLVDYLAFSPAFSPDGATLLPADRSGEVRLYDTKTWSVRHVLGKKANYVAHAPDGKSLAVGSKKAVTIYDSKTAQPLVTIDPAAKMRTDHIVYSPDGKTIAVGPGKLTNLWDAKTGKPAGSVTNSGDIMRIAFSPNGKMFATAGDNVRLWDAPGARAGGTARAVLEHDKTVCDVAWTPDGKQLVTVGGDPSIRVWNVADGSLAKQFPAAGGSDWIYFIELSPTASHAVSLSPSPTGTFLFDAKTWQPLATIPGRPSANNASPPAWYPTGKRFAIAGEDAINVYDV
jgi:WD40 repeat protein